MSFFLEINVDGLVLSSLVPEREAEMPKSSQSLSIYLRNKTINYYEGIKERLLASAFLSSSWEGFLAEKGIRKIHIYHLGRTLRRKEIDAHWLARNNRKGYLMVIDDIDVAALDKLKKQIGDAHLIAFSSEGVFYHKN